MLFKLAFLFLSIQKVFAFPDGAGGCTGGEPAVKGLHLSRPVTTGSLAQGGFDVYLGGAPLRTDTLARFQGTDITLSLVARTPDVSFKGFLLRLDLGNGETMALQPSNPSNSKVPDVCIAEKVSGVTHINSNSKMMVSASGAIPEGLTEPLNLDVTVVVQNTAQGSIYYYSQFRIQQQGDLPNPICEVCGSQMLIQRQGDPPNPICEVCGSGNVVTIPDAVVNFPNQPPFTCAQIEQGGLSGLIDAQICPDLPLFIGDACGCAPANTPAPTPRPPSPAPTPSSTLMPVDTPAPTGSCGTVGFQCRVNSDCCSRFCGQLPGTTNGECVSSRTASKSQQKLGRNMGGAGGRAKRI